MTDNLPVPAGAPPDALLSAIAMAAARIAAEQARPPVAVPLTRDDCELIARAAVVEAFKQFGVNLESLDSIEAHRSTLDHARRSAAFWAKAAGTIWSGVWAAIATGLIAAVVKFTSAGGGR